MDEHIKQIRQIQFWVIASSATLIALALSAQPSAFRVAIDEMNTLSDIAKRLEHPNDIRMEFTSFVNESELPVITGVSALVTEETEIYLTSISSEVHAPLVDILEECAGDRAASCSGQLVYQTPIELFTERVIEREPIAVVNPEQENPFTRVRETLARFDSSFSLLDLFGNEWINSQYPMLDVSELREIDETVFNDTVSIDTPSGELSKYIEKVGPYDFLLGSRIDLLARNLLNLYNYLASDTNVENKRIVITAKMPVRIVIRNRLSNSEILSFHLDANQMDGTRKKPTEFEAWDLHQFIRDYYLNRSWQTPIRRNEDGTDDNIYYERLNIDDLSSIWQYFEDPIVLRYLRSEFALASLVNANGVLEGASKRIEIIKYFEGGNSKNRTFELQPYCSDAKDPVCYLLDYRSSLPENIDENELISIYIPQNHFLEKTIRFPQHQLCDRIESQGGANCTSGSFEEVFSNLNTFKNVIGSLPISYSREVIQDFDEISQQQAQWNGIKFNASLLVFFAPIIMVFGQAYFLTHISHLLVLQPTIQKSSSEPWILFHGTIFSSCLFVIATCILPVSAILLLFYINRGYVFGNELSSMFFLFIGLILSFLISFRTAAIAIRISKGIDKLIL